MKKLTLAVCCLMSATSAFAASKSAPMMMQNYEEAKTGIYAEARMGYGYANYAGEVHDTDGVISGFDIGYKFNPYIGTEFGLILMPNNSITRANHAFDLAVKGIYPFSKHWSVFGKVGGGLSRVTFTEATTVGDTAVRKDERSTKATAIFALGGSYHINDDFSLNLEGFTYTKNGVNAAMYGVTLGVGLDF